MATTSSMLYSGRFRKAAAPAALLLVLLLLSPFAVLSEDAAAAGSVTAAPVAESTTTSAPASGWSGCVDPDTGYALVTIGQPTTVCLVLANDGDWTTKMTYMRLNFQPTADDYSRFHVPNSFSQLVGNPQLTEIFNTGGNITVHAESQTALSFQKLYYNGDDKIFPFLTAIIAVEKGTVTGITWDDACVFCGNGECEDNTYNYDGELATKEEAQQPVGGCHTAVAVCKLPSTEAECDLLLYVVWTGTDANGRDFASSANRFSAFPSQSWGDRVNLGFPDMPNMTNFLDKLNPFDNGESDAESDSN